MAAFTAPTYNQSLIPGTNGYPGVAAADDAALLSRLNLPTGWKVLNRTATPADSKGVDPGTTTVNLVGPNGEPDSVQLDANGEVTADGGLRNKPTPPKAPPAPVKPSQTQAEIDQAAADAHAKAIAPPASAAPRIDSPAETQTAASGAQNANTASAAQANTAANDKVTQDTNNRRLALEQSNATAAQGQAAAELVYKQSVSSADEKLKAGQLTLDQWTAERKDAHDTASDAVAKATQATTALKDFNDAQFQQGQLTNQGAQTAETARHNQAGEAQSASNDQANQQLSAATLLQKGQADNQASLDRGAATGASLLQQRGQEATSTLASWNTAMAGNKNFGLGGALPADFGQNLTQGAQQQATQSMGGQSLMDAAAKAVHAANPALSGTPQGGVYTALMQQMMEKQAQQQSGGFAAPGATPPPPPASTSLLPPGKVGTVDPSDPTFLGQVISAAVQHFRAPSISDPSNTAAPVQGPLA